MRVLELKLILKKCISKVVVHKNRYVIYKMLLAGCAVIVKS